MFYEVDEGLIKQDIFHINFDLAQPGPAKKMYTTNVPNIFSQFCLDSPEIIEAKVCHRQTHKQTNLW